MQVAVGRSPTAPPGLPEAGAVVVLCSSGLRGSVLSLLLPHHGRFHRVPVLPPAPWALVLAQVLDLPVAEEADLVPVRGAVERIESHRGPDLRVP